MQYMHAFESNKQKCLGGERVKPKLWLWWILPLILSHPRFGILVIIFGLFVFFYAPTSLEATKSDTPWEVGLICKHCIYVYIDINPGVEVVTDCEIIWGHNWQWDQLRNLKVLSHARPDFVYIKKNRQQCLYRVCILDLKSKFLCVWQKNFT